MRVLSPARTYLSHSIIGSVQGLGDGQGDPETFTCRWWELWKAYSGVLEEDDRLTCLPDGPKKEAPNPGPITNNELLNVRDDHSTLKNHADEGSGYRVLSQGSWDFLSKLYGKSSPGTQRHSSTNAKPLFNMISYPACLTRTWSHHALVTIPCLHHGSSNSSWAYNNANSHMPSAPAFLRHASKVGWIMPSVAWQEFSLPDRVSPMAGGGPAMPRPVLATCGKLRVEARPLTLQVFRWPDYDKAKPLQISRRVRPQAVAVSISKLSLSENHAYLRAGFLVSGCTHDWASCSCNHDVLSDWNCCLHVCV